MSSTEAVATEVDALPEFDLEYGIDDPDCPTSVTVYAPDAEDVCTTWISMDALHVVPLEDVA